MGVRDAIKRDFIVVKRKHTSMFTIIIFYGIK
jgi:hypothetical protein